MYRRVPLEWRIAWICGGFLIGVTLTPFVQIPSVWGIIAVIPAVILCVSNRLYAITLLFLTMIFIGLGYGSAVFAESRSAYDFLVGSEVSLSGRIKEDPAADSSGFYSLQLDSIKIDGTSYGGTVFTRVRTKIPILRSDVVTVKGLVEPGFGSFAVNLKKSSVLAANRDEFGDIGRVFRDWFAGNVRDLIGEPQASLGIGYLTGQKSALPEDLSDALKVAGLTHIVVASGYNLTVLVRLARRLLLRVSKFSAAMSALGMVIMFMSVTGLSPSMTRAGIVSGLSILFWYYGRKVHPIILLVFVAALTVAYQPSYVWGDLGWQLSFAAFFGVMVVGPLLQQYFFGRDPPGLVWQTLIETISAHVATLPVIALQFGVISNVAVVANLLVVPLVPLAMLLTFISGLWSIFGIGLTFIISVPTEFLLKYMVGVAMYVSEIKWAQHEINIPAWGWGVYVIFLLAACWWMWRATGYNLRTSDVINPVGR